MMILDQLLTFAVLSLRLRRFGFGLLVLFLAMSIAACTGGATGQRDGCVIASNDGPNGFRTDEISSCRVDVTNGNTTFRLNRKNRTRSYDAVQPLTPQYQQVAAHWLSRVDQLQVPPGTNSAGFDVRSFLRAASQATTGLVLIRNKNNGGQGINIAYITDGVYRSIDFSTTNVREIPSGFLTTGQ